MTTWTSWALALVQPLIARVLLALGISVAVYTGSEQVFQHFYDLVNSSWSGLPSTVAGLLLYGGVGEALSIIGAAIATKVAISIASKGLKFVKT